MTARLLSMLVILAIVVALFGIFLPLSDHTAHSGCPFVAGSLEICDGAFIHLSHWQTVFLAVFIAFIGLLAVFVVVTDVYTVPTRMRGRCRTSPTYTEVRSFFELLASNGILHPKAP